MRLDEVKAFVSSVRSTPGSDGLGNKQQHITGQKQFIKRYQLAKQRSFTEHHNHIHQHNHTLKKTKRKNTHPSHFLDEINPSLPQHELPHEPTPPTNLQSRPPNRRQPTLSIRQIPMLTPTPSELLLKVHACGVCHSDHNVLSGRMGPPRISRLGHEFIGTVVKLSSGVGDTWRVGDLAGGAWHGGHDGRCRECARGDFQMCAGRAINGVTREGGYGEYAVLRAEAAVRIPSELVAEGESGGGDLAEWAPFLCAGVTVFNGMRRMGVTAGDVVAVQGLGGLGHLAVQYARKMGFRTVALSRGEEKREFAMELGAHDYIDTSSTGEVAGELQKLGGAALIVETAPNAEAISPLIGGLAPRGTLLLHTAIGPVKVDSVAMVQKALAVRGWPSGHALDSQEAIQFARQNGVRCMVEKFTLDEVNAAMEHMLSGRARFRAVLTMD